MTATPVVARLINPFSATMLAEFEPNVDDIFGRFTSQHYAETCERPNGSRSRKRTHAIRTACRCDGRDNANTLGTDRMLAHHNNPFWAQSPGPLSMRSSAGQPRIGCRKELGNARRNHNISSNGSAMFCVFSFWTICVFVVVIGHACVRAPCHDSRLLKENFAVREPYMDGRPVKISYYRNAVRCSFHQKKKKKIVRGGICLLGSR